MIESIAINSDQIKQAAAAIKAIRPSYTALLNFYEQIFITQEDSKSHIRIEPILLSNELLSIKAKEQFPLINLCDFVIDINASELVLRKICHFGEGGAGVMSASAKLLINAIDRNQMDPASLFSAFLNNKDSIFERIAQQFGIDTEVLAFITYNSINPSITLCAQQLSAYLNKEINWEKGYCPICGSQPGLSLLQNEGERFLICGFCWHQWPVQRIFCPFCHNRDNSTLYYFFSEEENEYRVDVCESCKRYIKTIDTRRLERFFYPPLEQAATLHLDMKAKEKGLQTEIQGC